MKKRIVTVLAVLACLTLMILYTGNVQKTMPETAGGDNQEISASENNIYGVGGAAILPMKIREFAVGDTVNFAHYHENIEWYVLDVTDGEALLFSKYILDSKLFSLDIESCVWEDCRLRQWLNNEFYQEAFSEEEQIAIVDTLLTNEDNFRLGTDGGGDTVDKVFLLSMEEMETYFGYDLQYYETYDWSYYHANVIDPRMRAPILEFYDDKLGKMISVASGYYSAPTYPEGDYSVGMGTYWLRSVGKDIYSREAVYVDYRGFVNVAGDNPRLKRGIRPAIRVEMSAFQNLCGPVKEMGTPGEYHSEKERQTGDEYRLEGSGQNTEDGLSEGDGQTAGVPDIKLPTAASVLENPVVTFGSYEQDNDTGNGAEPINWYVLDIADGKALLFSVDILDWQPFHEQVEVVGWRNSDLRQWLNGTFYDAAFTEEEKSLVADTVTQMYGWREGVDDENTEDKVFLLSYEAPETYFIYNDDDAGWRYEFTDYYINICDPRLRARPTAYAAANGAEVYEEDPQYPERDFAAGYACWWRRNIYLDQDSGRICYASFIDQYGGADYRRKDAAEACGIRPALWVDVSALSLTEEEIAELKETAEMILLLNETADCGYRMPTMEEIAAAGYQISGGEENTDAEGQTASEEEILPLYEISEVNEGDTVSFGRYEQDNNRDNGLEPIDWYVLEIADGKALLFSVNVLDRSYYHTDYEPVTWEESLLRQFVNDVFYNRAFSGEEKACIAQTRLVNADHPLYGTDGGNDTTDRIFCLCIDDILKYFNYNMDDQSAEYLSTQCDLRLWAPPTPFAREMGCILYRRDDMFPDWNYFAGYAEYWLRSPARPGSASTINQFGLFSNNVGGFETHEGSGNWDIPGVRPAVWVDLEKVNELRVTYLLETDRRSWIPYSGYPEDDDEQYINLSRSFLRSIPQEILEICVCAEDIRLETGEKIAFVAMRTAHEYEEDTCSVLFYRENETKPFRIERGLLTMANAKMLFEYRDVNLDGITDFAFSHQPSAQNPSYSYYVWSPSKNDYIYMNFWDAMAGGDPLTRRFYEHIHGSAIDGQNYTYQWVGETERKLIRHLFTDYSRDTDTVNVEIWIGDGPAGKKITLDYDYDHDEYVERFPDIWSIYYCTDILLVKSYTECGENGQSFSAEDGQSVSAGNTQADGKTYRMIYGQDRWIDSENGSEQISYEDNIYIYDQNGYLEQHITGETDSPAVEYALDETEMVLNIRYENGKTASYTLDVDSD